MVFIDNVGVADDITFTPEDELAAYRSMLLIRRFEEKAGQLYALGAVHGTCPLCIGQEGLIVGMMMAAKPADPVITGYRSHGHMLARGVAPERIMAELMGRTTGLSGGSGGSLHMFAPEQGFYGGHGTPGVAAPIGAGLAFAAKYRKAGAVCLCFFGDGAAGKGRVVETYRIAAEWKLPIVFVIDNNAAAPGSSIVIGQVPSALAERGAPFALPGEQVDGIDVRKVRAAGRRAIARARDGEGPTILEMLTYQYRGHVLPPARGAKEPRRDQADPVLKARARLREQRFATEAELKAIDREVRETVAAAVATAQAAPVPVPAAAIAATA